MRLTELNPRFYSADGTYVDENSIMLPVGIIFDCPCGCKEHIGVSFKSNFTDHPCWDKSGNNFENLTLTPSIQRIGNCNWHGYVTNGEIITL